MFWLRSLLYATPLALAFAGTWLFQRVSELQASSDKLALVTAIREPVGFLNPLFPQSGVTREVSDLLFEPLLVRDDDLKLRPNLIKKWRFQTVVVIRCASEEAAGESEAMIRSGEYLEDGLRAVAIDRQGTVLTIALEGFESGIDQKLLSNFDPENLGDYLLVRLQVKHSIRESFETFLQTSVEKGQIKMLEYRGDTGVDLFVRGDTDLFLRELELYYESNMSLSPEIELAGERCHTMSHEMLVELRGDVVWHDGTPFTTKDLIFSYQELTRSGSPLPLGDSFWFVESLEAMDSYRLVVRCRDTPAIMLESWEKLPVLPSHLFEESGLSNEALTSFSEYPVGNGPYRLIERRRDDGVILERNDGYYRALPVEQYLSYKKFGSLEATLLALRSGQIDAIVPEERFSDWAERNPGTIRQIRGMPRFQHFIAWNLDEGPIANQEVRAGLAQAVNLEQLLRDTTTEFEQPVTSLFYSGVPYCDAEMPLPLFTPRGAENRLDEAGYEMDEASGMRLSESGEPLEFVLTVNEENPEHIRLANGVAEQWAALGVTVKVERLPWARILSERLSTRDFDGVLLSWELPFERDRFTTWHSSEAGEGGANFCGLKNDVVDSCVEELRYEREEEKVHELTERLQREIARVQPCLFLCDSGRIISVRKDGIVVVRTGVGGERNVVPLGIGKSGLESSRPWWVRKEAINQQKVSPE